MRFVCDLCDREYESSRSNKRGKLIRCPECQKAMSYTAALELHGNYVSLIHYKKVLAETGKREYITQFQKEEQKNIGPVNLCPKNCLYKREIQSAQGCFLLYYTGIYRKKDDPCRVGGCSHYIKRTKKREKELQDRMREIIRNEYT